MTRLRLLADWLFDWFLLPLWEAVHPGKGGDDAGQPQEQAPPDEEPGTG